MSKKTTSFIEKARERLLSRQKFLLDLLSDLSKESNMFDQQVKDQGDEALSLSMEKLNTSLQQEEIEELRHIEEALSRVEKGTYGICIECSGQIAPQRLEYFPYAARCITCQEAFEE